MDTNKILISLEVDDKGTIKIKQFGDETKNAIEKSKTGLESLKSEWFAVTAKIAAATAVIYGVKKALTSFVNEAAESEAIEKRLQFALETTGYSWQYAKSAVDKFANSIQETTRFSDDQALQALTDMMMYTNDFAKAQMGAKLAMDMSIRTGQDLGSASRLIGMAITGNVEMLGRYIPQLRNLDSILGENATMAQKSTYAMKIVSENFGGTAQADINTYSGKLDQMKNAWNDLKKTIGNDFLPVLKETFDWLNKIFKSWKGDELEGLKKELKNFEAWLAYGTKQGASGKFIEDYVKRIDDLKKKIAELEPTAEKQRKLAAETKKDVFPVKEYPMMKVSPDMWDYFKKAPGFIETIIDGVVVEVESVAQLNEKLKNEIELKERLMDLAPKLDRWEFEAGYGPPAGYVRDVGGGLISMADAVERNRVLEEFKNIQRQITDNWEFEGKEPLGQISARKGAQEAFEKTKEMDKFWADTATSMGQNFMSGFFNIFTGGIKNAGDAFKQFGTNLINSFSNVVQQLISNWLVFGSIMGSSGYTSGQKFGGLLGLLGIVKAQEGFSGMVNRPTGFIAGEGGREFVNIIPESKMRGSSGGQPVINYNHYDSSTKIGRVEAVDAHSFEQHFGPSIVNVVHKNRRNNGILRRD
jgi:polyhydroxyalkanoate synthesis regulator phasin